METVNSLRMSLRERSYDITVGYDILKFAHKFLNLDRRILIVTDSGVPSEYAEQVAKQCKDCIIATIPEGENSKSMCQLEQLLKKMAEFGI